MPLYEYRCKECLHEMEVLQKINDAAITQCEACHKNAMEKCVTIPGFRLKGSGYYETDEKPKAKQRHIAGASEALAEAKSTTETTTS